MSTGIGWTSPDSINPDGTRFDTLASTATPTVKLGSRATTRDGRVFYYAQAGAVALVAGDVLQAAAIIANHANCAVTATAAGSFSAAVTPGATGGAANLYQDGYVNVSTTPDGGSYYVIDRHAAITSSTEFTLFLKEPIQVAWTTSTKLDLVMNKHKNVIQCPATTLTGDVVGVAPVAVAIGGYFWMQTWGPCAVLISGTPGAGLRAYVPSGVAGSAVVDPADAAGTVIGTMMRTGVDTKWKMVDLRIAF